MPQGRRSWESVFDPLPAWGWGTQKIDVKKGKDEAHVSSHRQRGRRMEAVDPTLRNGPGRRA